MDLVTNVTWFVWKIRYHGIGRGSHLPGYRAENHGIAPLDRDHNTGKPHQDNLCFFRCLALHDSCHTKNLERDTKHHYEQYREAGLAKKKFHGVKLNEPLNRTVKTRKKKLNMTLLLHFSAALTATIPALFT